MTIKLVIVGPGLMPIPPPKGWGAVESLVWDYKLFMDKYHGTEFETHIINLPNGDQIIQAINDMDPDIVHIQYDNHANVALSNRIKCPNIVLTSHYAYIDSLDVRLGDGYRGLFNEFINATRCNHKIFVLSDSIANMYIRHGAKAENVIVQHNGANDEAFRFVETPKHPDKSIYLAKIDSRKRQVVYQGIQSLFFVGNIADHRFRPTTTDNYLGEWPKPHLYEQLTEFANLVLLSDGEAHPLVCCEALICGLGLVISEFATANLDTALPFIDVVPTDKLDDVAYVEQVIIKNRETSLAMRPLIRQYGITQFSWRHVVNDYQQKLKKEFSY